MWDEQAPCSSLRLSRQQMQLLLQHQVLLAA
jgi:hypothetical protein